MTETLVANTSGDGITTSTTKTPSTTNPVVDQLDERLVSKAALDAAEEQLKSLCAVNAGVFVSVERRAVSLEESLLELQNVTKNVEKQLVITTQSLDPNSSSSANDGDEGKTSSTSECSKLQIMSERHRIRRRTLLQHSSLLELLELPNLMDACVRSNLYDEALNIASFANTLERRHGIVNSSTKEEQKDNDSNTGGGGDSSIVVGRVIEQIRNRQSDLRHHLLHRLKGHVTMPQCLEVVTALRRLNSIDLEKQGGNNSSNNTTSSNADDNKNLERIHAAMELRLQVDFLEARDSWLDSTSSTTTSATSTSAVTTQQQKTKRNIGSAAAAAAAAESSTNTGNEELLDAIERYRTRCFEIATQFLAIFRSEIPTTSTGGSSLMSSNNESSSSSSLLSMWTTRRIHTFLSMLSIQLNYYNHINDSASLRDALESCVFFSTSMGRLGSDFTSLLPPIFEPIMLNLVVKHWINGINSFQETLKICKDSGISGPLISNTISAGVGTSSTTNSSSEYSLSTDYNNETLLSSKKIPPPQPPRQLLSLPPLARLINTYLEGLNELRRCLLPGIFTSLRSQLKELIVKIKFILQTNERSVLTPGLRGEAIQLREVAARMKHIFNDTIESYMLGSLEVALGDYNTARIYLYKPPPPKPTLPTTTIEDNKEKEEEEKDNTNNKDEVETNVEEAKDAGKGDEPQQQEQQETITTQESSADNNNSGNEPPAPELTEEKEVEKRATIPETTKIEEATPTGESKRIDNKDEDDDNFFGDDDADGWNDDDVDVGDDDDDNIYS